MREFRHTVYAPFRCAVALLLGLWCPAIATAEHAIHVSSLEWPPYSGARLEHQGHLSHIIREAFHHTGHAVHISFYPWSRTIAMVKNLETPYQAFGPAYYSEDRVNAFHISEPIGESPIGFVERKDQPIQWHHLDDLVGLKIGVVQDYVNTQEFDDHVKSGRLTVDSVTSDMLNIRKVAAGRVDIAVIDRYVLDYLLEHSPELAELRHKVQFNARPLEQKTLYLYFRRTPEGERMRDTFNAGLRQTRLLHQVTARE